ncbi:hypothetical protein ACFL6P_05880 [Candidatus Latescibacterota bacterium]
MRGKDHETAVYPPWKRPGRTSDFRIKDYCLSESDRGGRVQESPKIAKFGRIKAVRRGALSFVLSLGEQRKNRN